MLVKIDELERTCFGCPTIYEGITSDNKRLYAYLRHGFMTVDLDDEELFREHPRDLDGVCDFEDFQRYAAKHDIYLSL